MNYITLEQAKKAVRWAVTERGEDFTYAGLCKYVKDEEPSCLIGMALHHLGVPIEVLHKMDACDNDGGSAFAPNGDVLDLLREAGYEFESTAITFLNRAQIVQDAHGTWGNAERDALDAVLDEALT